MRGLSPGPRGAYAGRATAVTAGSVREEAIAFLRELLRNGALGASDVQRQAEQAGITRSTLRRARESLGITPMRAGFGSDGYWQWSLPAPEAQPSRIDAIGAQPLDVSTNGVSEHLRTGVASRNEEAPRSAPTCRHCERKQHHPDVICGPRLCPSWTPPDPAYPIAAAYLGLAVYQEDNGERLDDDLRVHKAALQRMMTESGLR